MAFAALLSATLAATARRLQATDCPCLSAAPSGSTYPTFTLAGETITYPTGAVPCELRSLHMHSPRLGQEAVLHAEQPAQLVR
eukprot:scaffold28246_cov63-Phaeocystis_antarctica.AAC.1